MSPVAGGDPDAFAGLLCDRCLIDDGVIAGWPIRVGDRSADTGR